MENIVNDLDLNQQFQDYFIQYHCIIPIFGRNTRFHNHTIAFRREKDIYSNFNALAIKFPPLKERNVILRCTFIHGDTTRTNFHVKAKRERDI